MTKVYRYHIEYLDENTEQICAERGIIIGLTFSEAVISLEEYYGEKNIASIGELICFDIDKNYVVTEHTLEEIGYKLVVREDS